MAELAKQHLDRLDYLKEKVEEAQEYFEQNVQRYNEFIRFVFKSSMTDQECAALADIGKPSIEFNITEAMVSRLRGEFAKQQPELKVRAADGIPSFMLDQALIDTIESVEGHLKSIFFDGDSDMLGYNIYTDLLAGGFSVVRVYTDYLNDMSMEQKICWERVFDPTLTVFDPLARESHKGDGQFCGELYPLTKKAFIEIFGEKAAENIRYSRNLSGFNWSFKDETEEIVLVCDYYEKKKKRVKLLKLSNGRTITEPEYKKFLVEWEEANNIEQPPIPVGDSRWTHITTICRYRFCEARVLDYIETDYQYLPLVFIDGNSINMREGGAYTQMTRPYVYHAKGIQKLKNFAGQTLANELENLVQHKFVVALESIPSDYQTAYQDVQKADTLIYNHYHKGDPNQILPPPREVQRTAIPPEITNTFRMTDEMTQAILGNYDSASMQSAPLSGIAFARSAIQSNNAAVPYIVGYIKGLNRVAQIIVDLIPKYYRTPRSLPVLTAEGKREYIDINTKNSIYMNYDPNNIQVKVDVGVNFAMQKEIALQTVVALSQNNKQFADFFAENGLTTILDNIDIRGIEALKLQADKWMKQQSALRQQAVQMQQSQAQLDTKMKELAIQKEAKEAQAPATNDIASKALNDQAQVNAAKVAIQQRDSDTKFIETLSKIQNDEIETEIKIAELDAENMRTQSNMLNKAVMERYKSQGDRDEKE